MATRLKVGPVTRGMGGGAPFYMRLVGLEQLERNLEALYGRQLDAEIETAAKEAMREYVLEPSQKIVPYATGHLHDSAYIEVEHTAGGHIRALVGYGAEYALFVHENPDAQHKPPTRWKFLEEPFVVNRHKLQLAIGYAVRRHVKRAVR